MCVYVSLCDVVCFSLLLPFVLGFCLFVFWCCLFVLFLWVCVCLCMFLWVILSVSFAFTIWLGVLSVRFFFLPFLLSCVAGRVSVLWLGVRPKPPRWESQVQDIGPPETSWPYVISIGESSPRDLHLNTKTQLHPMASNLQCWMPHAKQRARQEYNHTHQQRGSLKSY